MSFLIYQMWLLLLLAAFLGIVLGWWLRGPDTESRAKVKTLEGHLAKLRSEHAGLNAEMTRLKAAPATQKTANDTDHSTQIDVLKARIAELEGHLAAARAVAEPVPRGTSKPATAVQSASVVKTKVASPKKSTNTKTKAKVAASASATSSSVKKSDVKPSKTKQEPAKKTPSSSGAVKPSAPVAGSKLKKVAVKPAAKKETQAKSTSAKTSAVSAKKKPASATGKTAKKTGQAQKSAQPKGLKAPRGGKADDLKMLTGVGPKIEKQMNALGLYHFSQISDLSKAEVSWVESHIGFPGRMVREKWQAQAKKLASGKLTAGAKAYKAGKQT